MQTQKFSRLASLVAFVGGLSLAPSSHAADMQTFDALPAPDCGTPTSFTPTQNCIQFGDFSVYSLALVAMQKNFATTGNIGLPPFNDQDPYFVNSQPGELGKAGYIVYGTGTNNNGVVTNGAGTLIDDAQSQPTGAGSQPPFVVSGSTETNPSFAGDSTIAWDGTLSAIRAELGQGSSPGGEFVIYFNLNETGGDGLDGIDLKTWFKASLVDTEGVLPTLDFYLTGQPGSTSAPVTNDQNDPNWVYVHGTICVSPTAGFLGFGPCDNAQKALGGQDVNQNLGAEQAAFAIYNPQLSQAVLDPASGYDILRGTWQLRDINNGYEQEFSALTPFARVPEPGSLLLLGLGVFGIGLSRRYRRR